MMKLIVLINEPSPNKKDEILIVLFRPKMLVDSTGRSYVGSQMEIFIAGARNTAKKPRSLADLRGPPGMGKTTLSNIVAMKWGWD